MPYFEKWFLDVFSGRRPASIQKKPLTFILSPSRRGEDAPAPVAPSLFPSLPTGRGSRRAVASAHSGAAYWYSRTESSPSADGDCLRRRNWTTAALSGWESTAPTSEAWPH